MSKRFEVTHVQHYIGGRLVMPDMGAASIVTLPAGVRPGRWLKPLDDAPVIVVGGGDQFAAKHNGPGVGAGNWSVERIADGSRVSVVFKKSDGDAKAKAEAEAARLNAGGEIDLGVMDGAPSSAQEDLATSATSESGSNLPDA